MRTLASLALTMTLSTTSAIATPPDMVCQAESPSFSMSINLTTTHSVWLNNHGIIPLSIHHSGLTLDLPTKGIDRKISLYGEDLVGQWLVDNRVDLHFYKEITIPKSKLTSLNLKINTKSTNKSDEESGHIIHTGKFALEVHAGSLREGGSRLVWQADGDVTCR